MSPLENGAVQGTVASFHEDTSGEVVLDTGRRIAFDAAAFAVSGLRLLRPGQRVRLLTDQAGAVTSIGLITMHP